MYKKIIVLLSLSLVFGSFNLNEKEGNSRTINFNLSDISFVESDGYRRIQADKSGFTMDKGMP